MSGTRTLCLSFVDVGQGDATIVLPPEGEGDPIVFDCGDGWTVVQQLRTWGVDRLEAVIASHLDADHIGGILTLLEAYAGKIRTVYFSSDRDISGRAGAVRAKALADRVASGSKAGEWELRPVQRDGRRVSGQKDWSVHIDAPAGHARVGVDRRGRWEEPNRYSAVLRVEMAGRVVLVGGDAPLLTWSELHPNLSCDVFRLPHHGGELSDGGVPDGWSAKRLYDEANPDVAVVSVGTNNPHGHPDEGEWVLPLIARSECRLMCTQVTGRCDAKFARTLPDAVRLGAIRRQCEGLPPSVRDGLSHFTEPPWRHYGQRKNDPEGAAPHPTRPEVPCAGTISIRIDARGQLQVDPSEENASLAARIDGWSHPLCRRQS